MAETALPLDPRALESLLAFWAEAGVDVMLDEAPVDRLAAPPPPIAPPADRIAEAPASAQPVAPHRRTPSVPTGSSAAEEAVRLAADAPDLASLAEAVARFEGCALRFQGAARPVTWRGAAEAWVVAVGDAPTAEDEAAGEAFRSPGGRVAEALLDAAGLKDRVLFVNAVFWRTPGGAAPSATDMAACRPFVDRAIALARPRALITFGAAPAKGLLAEDQPILRARGRWCEFGALPALPTLAASFLIAQPLCRREVWRDVLSLANRVDAPDGRA